MEIGPPFGRISDEEWNKAVSFLLKKLDSELIEKIIDDIKKLGKDDWIAQNHFGLGMHIRNLIREDFEWGAITLDSEWDELLYDVIKKYKEDKK